MRLGRGVPCGKIEVTLVSSIAELGITFVSRVAGFQLWSARDQ